LDGGAPSVVFIEAAYVVETGEAERIAVDHVARTLDTDAGSSSAQLGSHLLGLQSAAAMLAAGVRSLHEYVAAVADGRLPQNHALLRQIAALLRQLPAASDPAAFESEFLVEVNDTLLLMSLTAATKGTAVVADVCDRLVSVHSEKGTSTSTRSRGGRGGGWI